MRPDGGAFPRMTPNIPFNRPHFPEKAFELMRDAAETRRHVSGDGHYTRECESWMEGRLGAPRVLLVNSCTSALEMALILLRVGPGDEVVVPSFTFVSCANVVALRGATPVFADIDPDTLSMSTATIEPCITDRTRAVMQVHYGGTVRDLSDVTAYCASREIRLIEDAAHAFLGEWMGRPLGTWGSVGAFSFHETKNFSMGEGGALVVNDADLVERAEIVREKGTNRKQFRQGIVDKYSWVDLAASYVASDLLAAMLWAQLLDSDSIRNDRLIVWRRYADSLEDWARANSVVLPPKVEWSNITAHVFYMLMPTAEIRDRFLQSVRAEGVDAVFHYVPLADSPYGSQFSSPPCPVADDIAARLVRLPLYVAMRPDEVSRVIEVVTHCEM